MKRPWQVWWVFVACAVGALCGMVWLTQQAIRSDQKRQLAEAQAQLEQLVSLALWRMDTELAPIIAAEVIRPASEFRPSIGSEPELPPYVLMQFEATPKGAWLSPQVTGKKSKDAARLAELSKSIDLPRLIAELPKAPLPSLEE